MVFMMRLDSIALAALERRLKRAYGRCVSLARRGPSPVAAFDALLPVMNPRMHAIVTSRKVPRRIRAEVAYVQSMEVVLVTDGPVQKSRMRLGGSSGGARYVDGPSQNHGELADAPAVPA